MSVRRRLPHRRLHELVEFDHGGFRYTAGIGRFADGRIAEVFLNCAKTGTAVEAAARDAAIVASIALQHGASPTTLQHALTRNGDGTASGPLGTLLDLLAAREGTAP
jgi:ribonucleoside-diphosphate reductase alpha chain